MVCNTIWSCVSVWRLSGGVVVDVVDVCQEFGPKRKVRKGLSSERLLHVLSRDGLECSFISKGDGLNGSGSGGFVRCYNFTG